MKLKTRQEKWDEEERMKTQLANLDLEKLKRVQKGVCDWMKKFDAAAKKCNNFEKES